MRTAIVVCPGKLGVSHQTEERSPYKAEYRNLALVDIGVDRRDKFDVSDLA